MKLKYEQWKLCSNDVLSQLKQRTQFFFKHMLSQSETLLPWTLGYGNLQLTVEVSNIKEIKSEAGSTYITENKPIRGTGRLIVRNSPNLKYISINLLAFYH